MLVDEKAASGHGTRKLKDKVLLDSIAHIYETFLRLQECSHNSLSLNYAGMTSSLLAKMICINEPD
jgi:hypothetical protein